MKNYIINFTKNYADEFNYTVRSIISESQRDEFIKNWDFIRETIGEDTVDVYFGTNEALEFEMFEVAKYIQNATEISDREQEALKKYPIASLNIIAYIVDIFMDKAYDAYDGVDDKMVVKCEELHERISK